MVMNLPVFFLSVDIFAIFPSFGPSSSQPTTPLLPHTSQVPVPKPVPSSRVGTLLSPESLPGPFIRCSLFVASAAYTLPVMGHDCGSTWTSSSKPAQHRFRIVGGEYLTKYMGSKEFFCWLINKSVQDELAILECRTMNIGEGQRMVCWWEMQLPT